MIHFGPASPRLSESESQGFESPEPWGYRQLISPPKDRIQWQRLIPGPCIAQPCFETRGLYKGALHQPRNERDGHWVLGRALPDPKLSLVLSEDDIEGMPNAL